MDFIVDHIILYLLAYKYVAIFLVAYTAAIIIPIPSGSALVAASAFASQGYFNIWWVVIISIIANIIGDTTSYYIAEKYGRPTLKRIGFRRILESRKFKELEKKFKQHPGFIIFISRFQVLSTLSVNLLSGMSKIPYRTFLLHEVLGTVLQVSVYAYIGYTLGENFKLNRGMGSIAFVSILLIVFIIFAFKKNKILKENKMHSEDVV